MAKRKGKGRRGFKPAPEPKFIDRNLANVNPLTEQFAPTDANPIRQHARMAGRG